MKKILGCLLTVSLFIGQFCVCFVFAESGEEYINVITAEQTNDSLEIIDEIGDLYIVFDGNDYGYTLKEDISENEIEIIETKKITPPKQQQKEKTENIENSESGKSETSNSESEKDKDSSNTQTQISEKPEEENKGKEETTSEPEWSEPTL